METQAKERLVGMIYRQFNRKKVTYFVMDSRTIYLEEFSSLEEGEHYQAKIVLTKANFT